MFESLSKLSKLQSLRLEKGSVDESLRLLENSPIEKLELVDFNLIRKFGSGFIKLRGLKQLLLIPVYNKDVAAINAEIVDFALSMPSLSRFFLGLTNEWLDSMNVLMAANNENNGGGGGPVRDSFPILVNGVCEMYSLSKLFKTLSAALPQSKVKILKMSQGSTCKQHLSTLMN